METKAREDGGCAVPSSPSPPRLPPTHKHWQPCADAALTQKHAAGLPNGSGDGRGRRLFDLLAQPVSAWCGSVCRHETVL